MDLPIIKSTIINQLKGTEGLYSLKLQNHIYGCFIVMEDIAQQTVDVSGTVLQGDKFSFDFDKQFSEIGLRYGFIMDTKLLLDTYMPEYKQIWIELFKNIESARDIGVVDSIEDLLIQIIQENIRTEDSFFLNALNTGSLTQEWIDIVLKLLSTTYNTPNNSIEDIPPTPQKIEKSDSDEDEDVKINSLNTLISSAVTEKPIHKIRGLARTRRNRYEPKKGLSKTRRAHKK